MFLLLEETPIERENITCKLIVIWPVYGNCIFPSAPSGAFCCGGRVVQEQQLCNLALGGSIGANSCTRTQTTARRRFQRKWRIPIDLGRFEVRCCGSISGIVSMTLFVLICTVKWLIFCWCDSCQKYTSNFKLYFFNILRRKKNSKICQLWTWVYQPKCQCTVKTMRKIEIEISAANWQCQQGRNETDKTHCLVSSISNFEIWVKIK